MERIKTKKSAKKNIMLNDQERIFDWPIVRILCE